MAEGAEGSRCSSAASPAVPGDQALCPRGRCSTRLHILSIGGTWVDFLLATDCKGSASSVSPPVKLVLPKEG